MGPSLYVERSRAAKADLAATQAVTEAQAAPGDFTMGEEQLRDLLLLSGQHHRRVPKRGSR